MNRKLFWGVLVIGVALVIAPFAFPPGLQHYGPLVTAMQGNVNDFKQVNRLPDFRLFTWFFVVPGALLALLAALGLWGQALELRIHHGARPTHA